MKHDLNDPDRHRPSPPEFQCGEEIDPGEVGAVSLHCRIPTIHEPLQFSCRGRSVGYLIPSKEKQVTDEQLEETYEHVDPCFFDSGYSLAGRTGFQVWAGSRLIIESLCCPQPTDNDQLRRWQTKVQQGAKVIELGAGVGVVGVTLAAIGAHVLLTDLPTLVENAIVPNLKMNSHNQVDIVDAKHYDQSEEKSTNENSLGTVTLKRRVPLWLSKIAEDKRARIRNGFAGAAGLDWTKCLSEKFPSPDLYSNVDLIVASDCVWLVSMLDALLDTVQAIFDVVVNGNDCEGPTFLMSFQRRDTPNSVNDENSIFTTVDRVRCALEKRGWQVDCLAWQSVTLDEHEATQEVYLLGITLSSP